MANILEPEETSLSSRSLRALRAEEEAWLERVYVPPAAISDYLGPQSMIFFGRTGSGRTALRLTITRLVEKNTHSRALVVNWLPEAPKENLPGNVLAVFAMRQLIGLWIEALLVHLAHNPQQVRSAPSFLHAGLSFLFHEYLPTNPQFYLLSRMHELDPEGVKELQVLLEVPPLQLVKPETTTQTIINTIASVLQQLGFHSTWVFVDGLEKWQKGLRAENRDTLAAMLDTLNYFDRKDIIFKVFALEEFAGLYSSLGGVDRYRLFPEPILWAKQQLFEMLNKRSAMFAPNEDLSIEQICSDAAFYEWLELHGGQTPRWWLLLSRPFINAYQNSALENGLRKPLDETAWRKIAAQFPPPLHIHFDTQQIFLGERAVKVAPSGFSILNYLIQNGQRMCSREEVYYRAVCGHASIPQSNEPLWEAAESWTSRLDTILWRLRKDIEPDPDQPVYVITARGKGIMIRNIWL